MTSNNLSNIGKATAWSFAAELAAKMIVPVTNIILARILAPEAFGIIAAINMIVILADTFSTAGFQKYLVQHDFKSKSDLNQSATVAFWTNFGLSMFLWIMIALFSDSLSSLIGNPGYGTALTIASLVLPLTGLSSIQESLFQRVLDYKVLFYRRLLVSLLPFVITIPLALLGFDYWSLIIGNICAGILKVLMLTYKCDWKPTFFYKYALLKDMFSFSMWTLLEALTMWASTYIDIFIISNVLGIYYTGLYRNSQMTVTGIINIITGATTSVVFSSLSRAQNDEKEFQHIFYSFQKNVAIFVLPMGVGILCFSDLITQILLGDQWMEASAFIGMWGFCMSLVAVFGTFSREAYRAKGEPKISLYVQLLHLAFIIPICIYFVNWGFHSFSYIRSLAYLQIILVHFVFIKVRFGLSPSKMINLVKEPITCSFLMGCCALLLQQIDSNYLLQFVYVLICFCLYFLLLYLFPSYRPMFKQVMSLIRKKIKI